MESHWFFVNYEEQEVWHSDTEKPEMRLIDRKLIIIKL